MDGKRSETPGHLGRRRSPGQSLYGCGVWPYRNDRPPLRERRRPCRNQYRSYTKNLLAEVRLPCGHLRGGWFFASAPKRNGSHLHFRPIPEHFFYALLRLGAGDHQLMAAAGTAYLKIHAHPKHQPLPAAAGVGFFQLQSISHMDVHILFPLCSIFPVQKSPRPLCQLKLSHCISYPDRHIPPILERI